MVSRDEALGMFAEKSLAELISNFPEDDDFVLSMRPMVDFVETHLSDNARIKSLKVTQCSRAHWRADVTKDPVRGTR